MFQIELHKYWQQIKTILFAVAYRMITVEESTWLEYVHYRLYTEQSDCTSA